MASDLFKMDALLNMIVHLVHLDFSSERFLWFIFYIQVFTPVAFIFVFGQGWRKLGEDANFNFF